MSHPLERVVYVDDEPHIRELARLSLERVGKFTTTVCESGPAALAVIPAFRPDLVLLDVMMPEMDGPQTLVAIRSIAGFADVPVVFVTAKAQESEIKRLMGLGALAVISKPFAPLEFPNRIRAIWDARSTRP